MMNEEQFERCWRVVGHSGSVFECSIHNAGSELEVRVSYGDDHGLLQSRFVKDAQAGRTFARRWLRTVLDTEHAEAAGY